MYHLIIQAVLFIGLLIILAVPLGNYIYKVMNGEKVRGTAWIGKIEKRFLRWIGTDDQEEMRAKDYLIAVLLFSGIGFVFIFLLMLLQGVLPWNPSQHVGTSIQLAFNTAISFITNTNWQAYAGESTLSNLTQALGLTVQNFVSAGTGIAIVFALMRGLTRRERGTIGNFWVDLTRSVLYILLPLSIILSLILVSQGVVQSLSGGEWITSLEGKESWLPLGPAASQIAIKQLGTNGGGFFGSNSGFPFENPTALSNLLQSLSILLIPASLCVSFGKAVHESKQGRVIFTVMMSVFVIALVGITISEASFTSLVQSVATGAGNMEGKEVMNGVGMSALWGTATTAASSGSTNASLDSFTPMGGFGLLFLMEVGEVIFGGVGTGLYTMIAFVFLAVFIAGLMVGRTPEYLGKKIEPFDMKMTSIVILVSPILALLGTALAVLMPSAMSWLTNSGPHGFSEVLYAFTSMSANNGSAFGGFAADTLFTNIVGGVIMLASRFVPIAAILFLAENMAKKKFVPASEVTLSTTSGLFGGLLVGVILLIGALSFLPTLALGPIADFFTSH